MWERPYGQISQLKVCQLLSAGPQVIYPVGLNGRDEPITITLLELLHSGASVITTKHPYIKIDIPLLPPEDLGHTTLPLGEMHAIPATNSPRTPWKPRISLATEVDALIIQAMEGDSSHEMEHSVIGKATIEEAVPSPSHKSEAPPLPVNTSSQASMEEGEASLKSNHANVSPTAATYSSHSSSPSVDLMELQADANLAANHMLSVKRSMDLKRQQVIWELGLMVCQNEAEEAASIVKAKLVHS